MFVDVGHTHLEPIGDPFGIGDVGAPHRSAEAELHIVRQLDRLVGRVHLVDHGHRTEDLLGVGVHIRGDVGQHGRLEERAVTVDR